MKAYTDISQSQKLAEILPLESADGYWFKGFPAQPYMVYTKGTPNPGEHIPCWSLAALLDVLPKGNNISTPKPVNTLGYCCWNQYDEIYADNPVDACYEMILKLHELNLL